ncbi:MAG: hypothetical protein AAFY31_18095, partial [Pseudomonadota bacterium]
SEVTEHAADMPLEPEVDDTQQPDFAIEQDEENFDDEYWPDETTDGLTDSELQFTADEPGVGETDERTTV